MLFPGIAGIKYLYEIFVVYYKLFIIAVLRLELLFQMTQLALLPALSWLRYTAG